MIDWPAVLRHANDPELDYFENLEAFENSISQNMLGVDADDVFIDSSGKVYVLSRTGAGKVQLRDSGKRETLEEVLALVKAHAAHAEYCCVAKLWVPTIREALSIVHSVAT